MPPPEPVRHLIHDLIQAAWLRDQQLSDRLARDDSLYAHPAFAQIALVQYQWEACSGGAGGWPQMGQCRGLVYYGITARRIQRKLGHPLWFFGGAREGKNNT